MGFPSCRGSVRPRMPSLGRGLAELAAERMANEEVNRADNPAVLAGILGIDTIRQKYGARVLPFAHSSSSTASGIVFGSISGRRLGPVFSRTAEPARK